jgi:hypothetical protein
LTVCSISQFCRLLSSHNHVYGFPVQGLLPSSSGDQLVTGSFPHAVQQAIPHQSENRLLALHASTPRRSSTRRSVSGRRELTQPPFAPLIRFLFPPGLCENLASATVTHNIHS